MRVSEALIVRGAREHNLKNIDLEIPRNALVVFSGLSGSGKSSLAFDTIFAEGQRRYVESLSSYARQFLGQMDKPKVEFIEGLSPGDSRLLAPPFCAHGHPALPYVWSRDFLAKCGANGRRPPRLP